MRGLESSQKKLYLAVKKELALYERKTRKELLSYEKSFRATLPQKKIRISSRPALLNAIESARVVLVGDFHPFRQSQKGFVRLVEGAGGTVKRPVIALECFQQAHQAAIGEYLSGLITADELRDKIDFERYWPFSWENYREILLLARAKKIPVIALNIVEEAPFSPFSPPATTPRPPASRRKSRDTRRAPCSCSTASFTSAITIYHARWHEPAP